MLFLLRCLLFVGLYCSRLEVDGSHVNLSYPGNNVFEGSLGYHVRALFPRTSAPPRALGLYPFLYCTLY